MVLRETSPKGCARPLGKRVGANPHHAVALAGRTLPLFCLDEETDAALRPILTPVACGQRAVAIYAIFNTCEEVTEADSVANAAC